jgi:putative transposase
MEVRKEETAATTAPLSNRDRAVAKQEFIDSLLEGCSSEEDLFGPEGVFTKLKGAVMERLLEAEMSEHLGHERQGRRRSSNGRNGHSAKTVQTETGPVEIQVPRDREGTFEPKLVKKHQRRLEGFDEKVIALYARGMTQRDIQQHLRELYGTDVSPELISRATDGVMDEFRAWQTRPLEPVYPVVYLDALFVSVRDSGQVAKRAFYVALGVRVDGTRDVLGLWVAGAEGSKFWLTILTELQSRGVQDILFVCADGLTGLPQAIEAAFPKAVHQTCVVHLIRSALRFVGWGDRKLVSAALRPIYHAESEQAAELALEDAARQLDARYPSVVRTFRARWAEFVPFLSYPPELRRMLYTTNAVESLNSQLRKTLRQRGPFPNDEAVFKLLFLAIRNAKVHWKRPITWTRMLVQLDILFEGRLPA